MIIGDTRKHKNHTSNKEKPFIYLEFTAYQATILEIFQFQ